MASTTTTFLKTRAAESAAVKPGQWHAGFSKVKKYAEDNKIPLIAAWSNGDACSNCVNFEKSIMQTAFTSWMKDSGCAFWFGCSSDKTTDDKYRGTGFKWAQDGKLTLYPYVRVWWPEGKVDVAKSGDQWTGGKSTGGATFVKNLQDVLKGFKPSCDNCGDEPSCDGGSCTDESCDNCGDNCQDCSDVEALIKTATTELDKNGMTKAFGKDILKVVAALSKCCKK